MLDKTLLGSRYTCFECGTKFYDLGRESAICPECGADQANAPVKDVKSLLSKGRGAKKRAPAEDEDPPPVPESTTDGDEDEEEEEEEIGLLSGNSDDDDLG